jgi:hypothetical protein
VSAVNAELLVDPAVSAAKFDEQIQAFRANAALHRQRGCWLLEATFPDALFVFCSPKVRPPGVIVGVRINFDNYDLWAPSVVFVDPFTGRPYKNGEMPTRMRRAVPAVPMGFTEQLLIQQYDGTDTLPFLCLAGVREYHNHPAHTGDDWLLHRDQPEGKLAHLLDVILKYAVEPIDSYTIGMQVTGFGQHQLPA